MESRFGSYSLGPETVNHQVEQCVRAHEHTVLLHDGHVHPDVVTRLTELSAHPLTVHDVRHMAPDDFVISAANTAVVYGCLQDDRGLPFADIAYAAGVSVQALWFGRPRGYLWRNVGAMNALEHEIRSQDERGFLKLDFGVGDFTNLVQAFDATSGRGGCIVEVGCYRGSSGGALLSYIRSLPYPTERPELSVFFMDVFGGFDYDAAYASSDVLWADTHSTEGLDVVGERLRAYAEGVSGLTVHVLRSNVITDPIPEQIVSEGVRMVNIDVDLYEAVAAGLARYAPLVVAGGIMICEDSGHTPLLIGAYKAVEEFSASEAGRDFVRIDLESGQTFFVKIGV